MRLDHMSTGLYSSWDLDDPSAWSGVIQPAARALRASLDLTPLSPAMPRDALVDRAQARLSSRPVLPAHSIATARRRSAALAATARRARIDAVVALASSTDLVRPLGVPTIQVTDATFDLVRDFYPMFSGLGPLGGFQGRWVERRAARGTAHFVVTSDWARTSLIDDVRIAPERITVAPFGPAIAPAASPRPRRAEGGPLRLLLVASDWERKNGAAALAIAARLRELREIELVVVGDAPAEAGHLARLVGRLDPDELSALYARSDVLLDPSRANASGVVITDALHHGLPVLAADVGGVRNLVTEDSGWLVSVADIVPDAVRILAHVSPAELVARSRAATAHARHRLTWEAWAATLATLEIPSVTPRRS